MSASSSSSSPSFPQCSKEKGREEKCLIKYRRPREEVRGVWSYVIHHRGEGVLLLFSHAEAVHNIHFHSPRFLFSSIISFSLCSRSSSLPFCTRRLTQSVRYPHRFDKTKFSNLKDKRILSCYASSLPPGRVFVGILDDAHDDDVSHLNSIMKQKRRQCRVYGVCDVVVVVVASPINFNTR